MKLVNRRITIQDLRKMSEKMFGNLVKAVVDIEKEVMALDGELHSDEENLLLQRGSKRKNLWGINLYPNESDENFIEFDSVINLKPSFGNKTCGVDDPAIKEKIIIIVNKLVKK